MTDPTHEPIQPEESAISQPDAPIPEEAGTPQYIPRPRWQIALAWVLLVVTLFAVGFYYYWIAYRYV